MRPCYQALSLAAVGAFTSVASASDWIEFELQTSQRLISQSSVGAGCTQEKDYGFGDLNKNGRIDLVVMRKQPFTTTGRRRNVLFMNEGLEDGHLVNGVLVDRTAEYAPQMLDLTNDRALVVVDVNGNGWLDVVTSTTLSGSFGKEISHPRVYINQGEDRDGNWLGLVFDDVDRIPTMPVEPRFCWVAAGDVTGNGHQDLYFTDYIQGPYSRPFDLGDRLLINDGTGYFTDESTDRMTQQMLQSSFGMAGEIADMNGNGVMDIVKDTALSPLPTRVSVSYNDPNNEGYFIHYQVAYGNAPYHVSVGDLNNNGRLDMVITDDGCDRYLLNQGNNSQGYVQWSSHVLPEQSTSFGNCGFGGNHAIADLNNNGWNDIIIADVDVDISGCSRFSNIYRNNANPPNVTFSRDLGNIPQSMLQGVHDVAVFDINGDGWLDLVVGRCTGTQVWIQVPPVDPCPADLNGDNVVDGADLAILLAAWGGSGDADLNGDGVVDGADLAILLSDWGACDS